MINGLSCAHCEAESDMPRNRLGSVIGHNPFLGRHNTSVASSMRPRTRLIYIANSLRSVLQL